MAHLGAQPHRILDTEVARVHKEARGGLTPGRLPEAVDGRSSAVGAERREQTDAEAERCRVVQPRQAAPPFLRPTMAAVEAALLCARAAEHTRGHHGQVGLAVRARGHARLLARGRRAPWRRRALRARGGCGGAARQQQLLELVVGRDGPLEAEAAWRLRPRGERVEAKLEHIPPPWPQDGREHARPTPLQEVRLLTHVTARLGVDLPRLSAAAAAASPASHFDHFFLLILALATLSATAPTALI